MLDMQTQTEFRRGVRAVMPMLIGLMPFGLILGAQAVQQGMTPLELVLMMCLNFAGGSEFAVVGLWNEPLPIFLILSTTFMINSRHILMGAALAPYIRHLPKRKLLPTLFFMIDESWAMGIAEAKRREQLGATQLNLPYYFGAVLSLYVMWFSCGLIGAWVGPMLGDLERLGFGMAFPAVFLVLVRGMWRNMRAAEPWLVSLVVACVVYLFLPSNGWHVIVGTLSGLVYAYFRGETGANK